MCRSWIRESGRDNYLLGFLFLLKIDLAQDLYLARIVEEKCLIKSFRKMSWRSYSSIGVLIALETVVLEME